ncbi:MAG: hypothetical protein COA69_09985 [Robiginitomaculum sp.]|nr:MAG: hypothetical protein COA69_09985 [Robiginitomaculum sp.]
MKKIILIIFALAVLIIGAAMFAMAQLSAGSDVLESGEIKLAVWQPQETHIGAHGLILISHGTGGSLYDHRGTAKALTKAGFIVVSVLHAGDNYQDHSKLGTLEYFPDRQKELGAALDLILGSAEYGDKIDPDRIGALGFSIGGHTVLNLLGARSDFNLIRNHCADPARDPRHCAYGAEQVAEVPDQDWGAIAFEKDVRIKAAVLINPVGTTFGAGDLDAITIPILLRGAEQDQILTAPFHAHNVHTRLPSAHDYQTVKAAHHFYFIEPMPWPLRLAGIEAAQDPKGFHRTRVLRAVEKDVVDFYIKHLQ